MLSKNQIVLINENDDQVSSLSKIIPTKVAYYQERGQNYPHWRHSKEEVGNKPNPEDIESDDSVSLDQEKDDKETTIILLNEIPIYMIASFVDD